MTQFLKRVVFQNRVLLHLQNLYVMRKSFGELHQIAVNLQILKKLRWKLSKDLGDLQTSQLQPDKQVPPNKVCRPLNLRKQSYFKFKKLIQSQQ